MSNIGAFGDIPGTDPKLLVLPAKHTRQPQGPVALDPAWPFRAFALPRNGVTLTQAGVLAPSGTSIQATKAAFGSAVLSTTQHQQYQPLWPTPNIGGGESLGAWDLPKKQVTALVVFCRRGDAGGTAPIFGNVSAGVSPYSVYGFSDAFGTLRFECDPGATNQGFSASTPIVNNKLHVAIATYDGASIKLWQDGVLVGSSFVSGDLSAFEANSANPRGAVMGNYWNFTSGNRSFVGEVYLGAVAPIALKEGAIRELSVNPWQIFKPKPSVTYFVPSVGGPTILTIAGATHGHIADALSLTTSASQLAIADATHGHVADSPTLSTQWLLTIAEAAHAHSADNLGLTLDTHLVIAEAGHTHTADSLGLTTEWLLSIANAAHGHSVDNVTLSTTGTVNLLVADAAHGHAADSLGLTSDLLLVVADALHAHAADSPTLSTEWLLTIAGTLHGHAADNLGLSTDSSASLTVADATHAHVADSLGLTLDTLLVVAGATHAHAADSPAVSTEVLLVIAGSAHGHAAENLTLALGGAATGATADEIVAAILANQEFKAAFATLLGEQAGAGTTEVSYTRNGVTVTATVPLPGVTGNRTNVVITGS